MSAIKQSAYQFIVFLIEADEDDFFDLIEMFEEFRDGLYCYYRSFIFRESINASTDVWKSNGLAIVVYCELQ